MNSSRPSFILAYSAPTFASACAKALAPLRCPAMASPGTTAAGATDPPVVRDLGVLVARAQTLASAGHRRLLGIAGPPGSGKSTLARRLVEELGGAAVLVPMDGFHLADARLVQLGRRDRKGAPDTFDAHGFLELLRRLRARP